MACYHIRIQGHLPDRYAAWFAPLTLTREPSGETMLAGELVDQADLLFVEQRDISISAVRSGRGAAAYAAPLSH